MSGSSALQFMDDMAHHLTLVGVTKIPNHAIQKIQESLCCVCERVLSNCCLFAIQLCCGRYWLPFSLIVPEPNLHRAWQSGGTLHAARGIESMGMIDHNHQSKIMSWGCAQEMQKFLSPFNAWKKCSTISWSTHSC